LSSQNHKFAIEERRRQVASLLAKCKTQTEIGRILGWDQTTISNDIKALKLMSQQFFFETLWKKAIPAKQRFKEIEEGAKREFVETVRDPYEIQKIGIDLIKKAEDEILILFSTVNAFRHQEKTGALQLLKEAASLGVKVRILVPLHNAEAEDAVQKLREENPAIDIRDIKKPLQTQLTTLIVDQASSLTVELKDDSNEDPSEAMGLATFSNSESTVLAYVSIFENMWMQSELHPQGQQ
jgi:two-component system sensor histidine kinase VicK